MRYQHRRKYLSYFSIILLFLSFVQLVSPDMLSNQMLYCPLRQQWDELHICGHASETLSHVGGRSVLFETIDMPCRLQEGMSSNQKTAEKTDDIWVRPVNAYALDYKQPEDARKIVPSWRQINRFQIEKFIQIKYQIYRLFTIVVTMVLFPYRAIRKQDRLFGNYKVTLWRNILYIHSTDGKKEKRFSEIIVC